MPPCFRLGLCDTLTSRSGNERNMTELRKRGGGGGDPDSADNISDKVNRPTASRERVVSHWRPRPQNKFLRLVSDAEAAALCVFSNQANKLVSRCNPATVSTQTQTARCWDTSDMSPLVAHITITLPAWQRAVLPFHHVRRASGS